MADCTPFRLAQQLRALQHQFLQDGSGAYADLLPDQRIHDALHHQGVSFRNGIYNPLVTLRLFLAQVLAPDGSCRAAVARFLAERAADGLPVPSADPGGYCKARSRLPEAVLTHLMRSVMAQAAAGGGLLPREISFKGAVQTVLAFAAALRQAEGEELARLCREVLRAIASHRVGDRPDRYEPRARKRRPKHYPHLNVPRDQAREAML